MSDQKPHPVELVSYFFPEQSAKANPQHRPDEPIDMASHIVVNRSSLPADNGRLHAVELTIESDEDTSSNPSYFYRVVAYGVFKVSDELEEQKMEQFLRTTPVQILVGVSRERIAELTGRGPWPAVLVNIGSVSHGLMHDTEETVNE